MRAGGLKSVVQNVASGKLARSETPVPSNVSQILVLSDAWIDAHSTALARAEMNLDKVLRSSDDFLKALQNLAKCVYAMPSGSERYQYPFALGIHFELKKLLQDTARCVTCSMSCSLICCENCRTQSHDWRARQQARTGGAAPVASPA